MSEAPFTNRTLAAASAGRALRWLAGVALLASTAAPAATLTTQPGGLVSAPVYVNGQGPFEFIVDSAASQTAILPGLRDRLSLRAGPDNNEPLFGAAGSASVQVFALDSLALDDRRRVVQRVISSDTLPAIGNAAGILGTDFLADYQVEFDLPGGAIHLREFNAPIDTAGWRIIPATLNRGRFFFLEGELDGVPITIVLDTGAQATIINPAAAARLGPATAAAAPAHGAASGQTPGHVRGATGHGIAIERRDFRSLTMGGLPLDPARIAVADLPVYRTLGLQDRPAMILGIQKVRHLRFLLDYVGRRMLVRS